MVEAGTAERVGLRPLLATLREDLRVHKGDPTTPGFQALVVYRLGRWGLDQRNPLIGRIVGFSYQVLHRVVRNLYGVELHRTSTIGRRVQFAHQGGIAIGRYATIGDDCLIRHGVTVGNASYTSREGWPVLGDRVSVGVGAVIFGRVHIGDDARIGPNAVVMQDVPAGSTAFVPPARVAKPPQGPRTDAPAPNPSPQRPAP